MKQLDWASNSFLRCTYTDKQSSLNDSSCTFNRGNENFSEYNVGLFLYTPVYADEYIYERSLWL